MAMKSLGYIQPGAAAVRVTNVDPTWAHSYTVDHLPGNTGACEIGDSNIDDLSGDGVTGILPKIDVSLPIPQYQSPTVESQQFPYNMYNVFLSAEKATDQFLVAFLEP